MDEPTQAVAGRNAEAAARASYLSYAYVRRGVCADRLFAARIAVDWTHRVQTVANPLRYRQAVPMRIDRQFRRADARVDLTQTLSHN